MPEIIEVETYRRTAERVIGRTITSVHAPDTWFCKGDTSPDRLHSELVGARISGARRHGKLLLLDLSGPVAPLVLGLRFGMTGRLLVDGCADIDALEYSSDRNDPAWDRFGFDTHDGGSLRLRDPRRLGGVEIEPDVTTLGPDAATLSAAALRSALHSVRAPIKAALLDQHRVAGIGNLLVDEILWRSGIDPARPADRIDAAAVAALASSVRRTIALLTRRGGSHTGDLMGERHAAGRCPKDGTALRRATIGGRTTYWCPSHQA